MTISGREILRRVAHLPILDRIGAWAEDVVAWARLAGTARRREAIRRSLAACRTPEDFLRFIRPILPLTQIDAEICALLALVAQRAPERVLEIGRAQGGTAFLLSRAIPSVVWTLSIDLCPRHSRTLRFFNAPGRAFHSVRGSSRDERVFAHIARQVAAAPVDLLFIDGDHSYDGVAADYHLYRPLVRPGGLIVFHDIVPAATTGDPRAGHRWVGGVPRFWQEVRSQGVRSWEFVTHWEQGGFGIGAIETAP